MANKDKFRKTEEDLKQGKRRGNSKRRGSSSNNRSAGSKDYASRGLEKTNAPTSRNNDASWWNKFADLTDVVCNLSWNVMQGAPRARVYSGDLTVSDVDTQSSTLDTDIGVGIIETIPCLGACSEIGDPINKAMIEIYNMVRWNKNANVPYDPADIGKLLWAYDSFVSYLACMRRFYALTNAVDPRNRYVAASLMYAMGVDPDDMYANKANLLYGINTLSIQAAKINIPAEFKVFDRHELLYDNVFIDSSVARGSYYIFVPRVLAKYDDSSLNIKYVNFINTKYYDDADPFSSGALPTDIVASGGTRKTVADLISFGWELLNAIQTSSDFYMLNANIYGAYSERGLHPVKVIDSFYSISPLYREEVLNQIHNADFATVNDFTTVSVIENATEGDPNVGALEFCVGVTDVNGLILGYNKVLDMPWESPTKDDVLEATRFKLTAVEDLGKIKSGANYYIDSSGTEIALSFNAWYFHVASGVWHLYWEQFRGEVCDTVNEKNTTTTYYWLLREAGVMTKLDHYPMATMFRVIRSEGVITTIIPLAQLGDLDNYAMLDVNQTKNIHTAALLSVLLNGPTVLSHPVNETK